MRNLVEYPITEKEIVDRLRALSIIEGKFERVGDTTPLILQAAAEIVEAAGAMLRGIDARLEGRDALRYVTPWDKATDLIKAFHVKQFEEVLKTGSLFIDPAKPGTDKTLAWPCRDSGAPVVGLHGECLVCGAEQGTECLGLKRFKVHLP